MQSVPAQSAANARLHEEAMEAYVAGFAGTNTSVFSPITPAIPSWVGDVPTFPEWVRWFGGTPPADVAHALSSDALRGELGYVFMIIDVDMQALVHMSRLLRPHVQLVGHRELISLAHKKRNAEMQLSPMRCSKGAEWHKDAAKC